MRKRPNYLNALHQHLQDAQTEPGVHHVEVRHDGDCRFFDGGTCDCEPEVESGARIEEKYDGIDSEAPE